MEQRIKYIDRLKGLAMLAVVVGHLLTWSFDDAQSPVALLVSTFEMPVFMFLSGLVIANIPSNRKCFRKMLQFLCPMIIRGEFSVPIAGEAPP